jgi:hypothetical protein
LVIYRIQVADCDAANLLQKWRQAPGSDAIRKILVRTDPEEVEKAFREYSSALDSEEGQKHICFDGKSLNGSFSKCRDQRYMRVLNVFCKEDEIVLGRIREFIFAKKCDI